jgi:hypothetical protein
VAKIIRIVTSRGLVGSADSFFSSKNPPRFASISAIGLATFAAHPHVCVVPLYRTSGHTAMNSSHELQSTVLVAMAALPVKRELAILKCHLLRFGARRERTPISRSKNWKSTDGALPSI